MIQFLVHHKTDNVGVAVVDIKAGQALEGRLLETNELLRVKSLMDIPLGHKIALTEMRENDSVFKYGCDIGRIVQSTKTGEHVHVHNLKTKRWA